MTDQLRSALTDLVEVAEPPPTLGTRALAAGNRRRRNGRIVLAGAITAAVAAVAIAVPALIPRQGRISVAAPPGLANGSRAILSFEQHLDNDPTDPNFAWDPDAHRYVNIGQRHLYPSADGTWALTFGDNGWAVGRWADVLHQRGLTWHTMTRSPGWGPRDAQKFYWEPDANVLVLIDLPAKTVSYLDPATQQGPHVSWPAAVTANHFPADVVGVGVFSGGRVTFRVSTEKGTTLWVMGQDGRVISKRAYGRASGLLGTLTVGDRPSPDGRYLVIDNGEILDVQRGTVIKYTDIVGQSGGSAGFVIGWYDNTHLLQTNRADGNTPVKLTAYDVRTGRPVRSRSLLDLPPDAAPFITDLTVATPTAATAGATLFNP